jgi:hypothetical protein
MQTTIPRKFDLNEKELDGWREGLIGQRGFYWSAVMRMLKMEGRIG